MSVQYTRVCAVHWGMFSTLGRCQWVHRGYYEYTGIPWLVWGDIMSTLGDVQYTGISIQIELFPQWPSSIFIMISPRCTHNIPRCTHDIMYSWSPPPPPPPSVLNIPCCTAHVPVYCTDIMQGGQKHLRSFPENFLTFSFRISRTYCVFLYD